MKAITIIQPWATLWALDIKRYETRGWAVYYRGPLAIHASKKIDKAFCEYLFSDRFQRVAPVVCALLEKHGLHSVADFPLGSVIATCNLVACWPTATPTAKFSPGLVERLLGDFSAARFAWEKDSIRLLPEPIPAKGAQGLWEWQS